MNKKALNSAYFGVSCCFTAIIIIAIVLKTSSPTSKVISSFWTLTPSTSHNTQRLYSAFIPFLFYTVPSSLLGHSHQHTNVLFFFFLKGGTPSVSQAEVQQRDPWLTPVSTSWAQAVVPPQPPE